MDSIDLPFRSWPHESVVRSASLWRMLDLDNSEDGQKIDLVIATKFPSYYLTHKNKVIWLIHQFRQVYDWYETDVPAYNRSRPDDYQLLRWIVEQDRISIGEARAVYTISGVVRDRLRRYLNLDATVLYPPPPLGTRYTCTAYEPEILIVQRLDSTKRTDLVIKALKRVRSRFRAYIVGTGPEEERLRTLVRDCDLSHCVRLEGRLDDEALLKRYARCMMVVYTPYDEDYGFVPIEAFASQKPVVTTTDSGGPLEFVTHRVNGWIAEPDPESIAAGIQHILDQECALRWGKAGLERIRDLNWDHVADVLTNHLPRES